MTVIMITVSSISVYFMLFSKTKNEIGADCWVNTSAIVTSSNQFRSTLWHLVPSGDFQHCCAAPQMHLPTKFFCPFCISISKLLKSQDKRFQLSWRYIPEMIHSAPQFHYNPCWANHWFNSYRYAMPPDSNIYQSIWRYSRHLLPSREHENS